MKLAEIPADDIAREIGSPKVANIVVIGAYIGLSGVLNLRPCLPGIEERPRHTGQQDNPKAVEHAGQKLSSWIVFHS